VVQIRRAVYPRILNVKMENESEVSWVFSPTETLASAKPESMGLVAVEVDARRGFYLVYHQRCGVWCRCGKSRADVASESCFSPSPRDTRSL